MQDSGFSLPKTPNDGLNFAFKPHAGMVHIDDCTVAEETHVPFGGVKNSGFGREGGRFSIEEMTEVSGSPCSGNSTSSRSEISDVFVK